MSAVLTPVQVTAEPTTHTGLTRAWARYAVQMAHYWVDCATVLEHHYTSRATVPVLASVLAIIGGAIVGVNL